MSSDRSSWPRLKTVVWIAAVVAVFLAVLVWSEMRSLQENQRIHDENLVKAEQFKREFDQHITKGATVEAVEDYLRTRPVKSSRSLGIDDGRTFVSELMVETAEQNSPVFGCGRYSVGIVVTFAEERLVSTRVSSWSFDCV